VKLIIFWGTLKNTFKEQEQIVLDKETNIAKIKNERQMQLVETNSELAESVTKLKNFNVEKK